MHQPQLGRVVAHEDGGEGGVEAAAAGVEFHKPLLDDLVRPRQQ